MLRTTSTRRSRRRDQEEERAQPEPPAAPTMTQVCEITRSCVIRSSSSRACLRCSTERILRWSDSATREFRRTTASGAQAPKCSHLARQAASASSRTKSQAHPRLALVEDGMNSSLGHETVKGPGCAVPSPISDDPSRESCLPSTYSQSATSGSSRSPRRSTSRHRWVGWSQGCSHRLPSGSGRTRDRHDPRCATTATEVTEMLLP